MTESPKFSINEIEILKEKYSYIFSNSISEYEKYTDIGNRKANLSYLPFICSDFRKSIDEFHKAAGEIEQIKFKISELNSAGKINIDSWQQFSEFDALYQLINNTEIGTSIGLNKFSDDLIFQWKGDNESKLLIMIGHDWYPIVTEKYVFPSLFEIYSINDKKNGYWQLLDGFDFRNDLVLLFNLIPGYRKPYAYTSGGIFESDLYRAKAQQLIELINSLKVNFNHIKIIIWGKIVRRWMLKTFAESDFEVFSLSHPVNYGKDLLVNARDYFSFLNS